MKHSTNEVLQDVAAVSKIFHLDMKRVELTHPIGTDKAHSDLLLMKKVQ